MGYYIKSVVIGIEESPRMVSPSFLKTLLLKWIFKASCKEFILLVHMDTYEGLNIGLNPSVAIVRPGDKLVIDFLKEEESKDGTRADQYRSGFDS